MGSSFVIDDRLITESMDNGVCVTDLDRRIVYWNEAAERITNWRSKDIVGYSCFAGVFCPTDKNNRSLCTPELCPLQRAMTTGLGSECPLLFIKTKDRRRIPVQATFAPLRRNKWEIIGGVQVFRDISQAYQELANACAIQTVALQHELPQDTRVKFTTQYFPQDLVGGDYYAIEQLSADQYCFLLADVMGHGLAASLYTMYLRGLWDRYHPLLTSPASFARRMNHELNQLFRPGESFAAGVCGMVDLARREAAFTGAGNPPVLWIHANGKYELLSGAGVPLGVMEDAPYDEARMRIRSGDRFLLVSDGVVEVANGDHRPLGVEGLIGVLKRLGYPGSGVEVSAIREELLRYSKTAVQEDDQTVIEIRFPSGKEKGVG